MSSSFDFSAALALEYASLRTSRFRFITFGSLLVSMAALGFALSLGLSDLLFPLIVGPSLLVFGWSSRASLLCPKGLARMKEILDSLDPAHLPPVRDALSLDGDRFDTVTLSVLEDYLSWTEEQTTLAGIRSALSE